MTNGDQGTDLARGQWIGSLVSTVFGAVYVGVNTAQLAPVARTLVRVAGGAVVIAVVVVLVRRRIVGRSDGGEDRGAPVFGRAYWWLVLAEVVAIMVGVRVLAGPMSLPDAGVAWVSFVVGLHFFPLARIFRVRLFVWLGASIGLCGIVGLALAFAHASAAAIAAVAGLVPGAILLGAAWHGARTLPDPAHADRTPVRPSPNG